MKDADDIRPRGHWLIGKIGAGLYWLGIAFILMAIFGGTAFVTLVGLRDDEASRSALDRFGYQDIHIGEPARRRCSNSDFFSNEFTATNVRGDRVSGIVCCGVNTGCADKACTVRF